MREDCFSVAALCSLRVGQETDATNHYAVLKQATVFSLAGGFTGRMTPEAESVAAIAKQTDAVTVFTKLTRDDSPAAKLYGLLGLQVISPDQLKNELPKVLKNKSSVRVLEGCIMGTKEVADKIKEYYVPFGDWKALH